MPYPETVDEALCFGWIDSRPNKLDDERAMRLFTPRNPKGPWSRINKKKGARLSAQGLMAPAGMRMVEAAKANGAWTVYDEIEDHRHAAGPRSRAGGGRGCAGVLRALRGLVEEGHPVVDKDGEEAGDAGGAHRGDGGGGGAEPDGEPLRGAGRGVGARDVGFPGQGTHKGRPYTRPPSPLHA